MTVNEAIEILIHAMQEWSPEEDIDHGEVKGPVSEDYDYSFYFEIPEYDRKTGKTEIQLYEVNKKQGKCY